MAKTSEFHGIICYGKGDSHNHLDVRKDNANYAADWSWPAKDSKDRDNALGGGLCTGSEGSPPSTGGVAVGDGPSLQPWGVTTDGLSEASSELGIDPAGEAITAAHTLLPEEVLWIDDSEYVSDIPGGVCDC